MKVIQNTALILALFLVFGCETTFRPWNLSNINEGMERDEVVRILGQPDSVETTDGMEILHYSYRENYNPPLQDDYARRSGADTRLKEEQMRKASREYHYVIKLVDGKVLQYKEVLD